MARDMTQGNITKHLLLYAGPLIIGDLFQQLYHTVDSVVVGQFRGKEALAAIGARRACHEYPHIYDRRNLHGRLNFNGQILWSKKV